MPKDDETEFETSGELRRSIRDTGEGTHSEAEASAEARAAGRDIGSLQRIDLKVQRGLGRRMTMLAVGVITLLILLALVVYFLWR